MAEWKGRKEARGAEDISNFARRVPIRGMVRRTYRSKIVEDLNIYMTVYQLRVAFCLHLHWRNVVVLCIGMRVRAKPSA